MICRNCKIGFVTKYSRQSFCSLDCQHKFNKKNQDKSINSIDQRILKARKSKLKGNIKKCLELKNQYYKKRQVIQKKEEKMDVEKLLQIVGYYK